MTDIKLGLSDESLRNLMSDAILRAIDEKSREALIGEAIKHLLTPAKASSYDNHAPMSPLQRAFNEALRNIAYDMAKQKLEESPEVRAKVDALFADAMTKAFDADRREQMVESLARKVAESLTFDK